MEDNTGDIYLVLDAIAAHYLDADVYIMNDGEQALQFFRQTNEENILCPDFLLLDLNVPKFNGFDILAQLRAFEQCRQMPTIIMPSSSAKADITKSETYKVDAYFLKPSTYTEFLTLGEFIKKHI